MMANATVDTAANAAEKLADLCADLLAEVRYEPFLTRLFAGPAGEWQLLAGLLSDLGDIHAEVAALDKILSNRTRTAWLEYPECADGPDYATVMFFNEGEVGRIWVYNRGRLIPPPSR